MKIGFSSLVSPGWGLETMVARAKEYGFDGIELRGLRGELHLPTVPELSAHPAQVRAMLAENKIELVSLGCSSTLDSKKRDVLARSKQNLVEFIELAQKLGCPFVRILAGEVQRWDNQRQCLGRIARELISLAPIAARHNVTLLVENGGDFQGSADMWFLVDAVAHPAVRCCWNQCTAMTIRERATNSIPRLGQRIGMMHMCDARFSEIGYLEEFTPLGEGHAEIARQVELLRGMAYGGYLMFEWPKLWMESLPPAEQILPQVAEFLRARLADKQAILSAYKGDKNAPKYVTRAASVAAGEA